MFPKRGAAALAVTAFALILLLSFKTPDQVVGNSTGATGVADIAPASPTTVSGGAATAAPTATIAPTSAQGTKTFTGTEVDTQFGPTQVQITVSGGKITAITAVQLPTGGRSGRISQQAEPRLQQQALQAQSANIDGVSGATYTSYAYAQSLQAALDQAGI